MAIPSTTYDIATATNPSAALTDFTFMVDLSTMSAAWWTGNNTSDGTRGRASKGDGTTELATDWIDFDDTAETGWLAVKWTGTLASSGTQEVRIYPPNTANTAYAVDDTYGSENAYKSANIGSFPMYESATPLADRTAAGNSIVATGTGLTFGSSGQAGLSLLNDGSNPLTSLAIDLSSHSRVVVDAWVYWDTFANDDDLLWEYTPNYNPNNGFICDPNSAAGTYNVGLHEQSYSTADYTRPTAAAWHKITADYDMSKTTDEVDLYIDGVLQTATSRTNFNNSGNFDNDVLYLLSRDGDSLAAAASIQHLNIYTARSAAEITEDFDQVDDNATFWGTWTNVPVGPTTGIAVLRRRMEDAA